MTLELLLFQYIKSTQFVSFLYRCYKLQFISEDSFILVQNLVTLSTSFEQLKQNDIVYSLILTYLTSLLNKDKGDVLMVFWIYQESKQIKSDLNIYTESMDSIIFPLSHKYELRSVTELYNMLYNYIENIDLIYPYPCLMFQDILNLVEQVVYVYYENCSELVILFIEEWMKTILYPCIQSYHDQILIQQYQDIQNKMNLKYKQNEYKYKNVSNQISSLS